MGLRSIRIRHDRILDKLSSRGLQLVGRLHSTGLRRRRRPPGGIQALPDRPLALRPRLPGQIRHATCISILKLNHPPRSICFLTPESRRGTRLVPLVRCGVFLGWSFDFGKLACLSVNVISCQESRYSHGSWKIAEMLYPIHSIHFVFSLDIHFGPQSTPPLASIHTTVHWPTDVLLQYSGAPCESRAKPIGLGGFGTWPFGKFWPAGMYTSNEPAEEVSTQQSCPSRRSQDTTRCRIMRRQDSPIHPPTPRRACIETEASDTQNQCHQSPQCQINALDQRRCASQHHQSQRASQPVEQIVSKTNMQSGFILANSHRAYSVHLIGYRTVGMIRRGKQSRDTHQQDPA